MIWHVVLYRPRPELSAADLREFARTLETAHAAIPSVRRFTVGRRVERGPTYATPTAAAFPYMAIVEFSDRKGLDDYLAHATHEALGRAFHAGIEDAVVADYDVVDAGRATDLLSAST